MDQPGEAESGASLDERQVRVARAAEVLAAARHQSEQILHDAERLAVDVLNTGDPGALPSDRLAEALGELVAHLRRFFVAWQDGQMELREQLRSIRSLLARDSDVEPAPAELHLVVDTADAALSDGSPPPIPITAKRRAKRAELREELEAIRSLLARDSDAEPAPAELHLVVDTADAAPPDGSPPPIPITAAKRHARGAGPEPRKRARSS